MTEPSVDDVAVAVLACDGVAALSGGPLGDVASYLPGRRVTGVRLAAAVEVHIVAEWDQPLPALAERVHDAVAALLPAPRSIVVSIEDVEQPAPAGEATGG